MRFALWVALACLVAGCATSSGTSLPLLSQTADAKRQEIARVLDEVHQGLERKKIFAVLAHLSPRYADEDGRTQADARDTLKEFFSQWRTLRVTRTNPRLRVEARQAVALESIGVIAEPFDVEASPWNWFGEVRISLEQDDSGEWVITRVGRTQ